MAVLLLPPLLLHPHDVAHLVSFATAPSGLLGLGEAVFVSGY